MQAAGPTTGLAATLLGVATHAMHAVTEGLHNVLDSGRQLAAEADAGSAELAAGGGSTAAGSEAGNGAEEGVGEEGAAGAGASAVLPASPKTQEQSMEVSRPGWRGTAAGGAALDTHCSRGCASWAEGLSCFPDVSGPQTR